MIYGDPSAPARSHHRRRALDVIESAFRTGWITTPDHDLRIAQVETAATVGELNALIRDLADGTIGEPAAPVELSLPVPDHGGSLAGPPEPVEPPPAGTGAGMARLAIAALVGLVAVVAGVVVAVGHWPQTQPATGADGQVAASPTQAVATPRLHYARTAPGIALFKRDFAARFGAGTEVTAVSLEADFALVTLPDATFSSYTTWVYMDGRFTEQDVSTDDRGTITFDLRDLDGKALAATLRAAPQRVGVKRALQRTVIVTALSDGRPAVLVGVANKRGDYGEIATTLGGRVLDVRRFVA